MPATENSRKKARIIALGLCLLILCLGFLPAIAFGGEVAPPEIELTPTNTLLCGGGVALNVDFKNIPDLYGYQFKVHYDEALAEASGAFVNGWFDAGNGVVPPDWDGQCAGGECRFAASLLNPAKPISGGGAVATIDFTPLGAGTFDVVIAEVVLSDIDGFPIAAEVDATPLTFTVCGQASVIGTISLQGRLTPLDSGWITLIDTGGDFPDISTTFDAAGAYSVNDIPVLPAGSTYTIQATHYLYLGNEKDLLLIPGGNLSEQNTMLLGGDANNSGLNSPFTEGIDISDIGCLGNWFRLGAGSCGSFPGNSTDINKDSVTNIQDLAMMASNYMKHPFQPW